MFYGFHDITYFIFLAPGILLALWAQMRVHSTYAEAQRMPAPMTGAAAARYVLDSAGLNDIAIEQTPGTLSDHYDPRDKVLRLSPEVYQGRSLAAVGIAAHEAGHALQDAQQYAPMTIRNIAVPVASFGSWGAILFLVLGVFTQLMALVWVGVLLFGAIAFFQVVNLPVEFNASNRAKQQLVALGIIDQQQLVEVSKVLDAAAWTYVAATLQAVMTFLYYALRFTGGGNRD